MKKMISLFIAVLLILSPINTYAAMDGQFLEEANILNDLGVFDGKSSQYFDPALLDLLTREEGMKILSVVFSWNIDSNSKSEFSDVSNWAQPYVKSAVDRQVTKGIGAGKFGGSQQVTYAQFYTWVLREFGYDDVYSSNELEWESTIKEAASSMGIIYDEVLDYSQPISRDYAVAIMHGLLPLAIPSENESVIFKIIKKNGTTNLDDDTVDQYVNSNTASLQLSNSFYKNSMTQVQEKDSTSLIIRVADLDKEVESITAAICGRELCLYLNSTTLVKKSEGEYSIVLDDLLDPGATYYISQLTLNHINGDKTIINQVVKHEFLVVNDNTDEMTSVIEVASREELDNFINHSGMNIGVDFYAQWCGYCTLLEPIYLGAAEIVENEMLLLKVDSDVIDISGFGVTGYPTQLFYKKGDLVGNIVGYMNIDIKGYADYILKFYK